MKSPQLVSIRAVTSSPFFTVCFGSSKLTCFGFGSSTCLQPSAPAVVESLSSPPLRPIRIAPTTIAATTAKPARIIQRRSGLAGLASIGGQPRGSARVATAMIGAVIAADPMIPLAAAVLHVGVEEPERVLAVECGEGDGALFLAREFPRARVRGVDASADAVARATARVGLDPEGRIAFKQGGPRRLPFPDDHFDLVVQARAGRRSPSRRGCCAPAAASSSSTALGPPTGSACAAAGPTAGSRAQRLRAAPGGRRRRRQLFGHAPSREADPRTVRLGSPPYGEHGAIGHRSRDAAGALGQPVLGRRPHAEAAAARSSRRSTSGASVFRVQRTRGLEHGVDQALRAVEAGEIPVVVSGDGLVGAIGGAMAGAETPLGIIPGGRGNDLARVLGIPDDPEAAVAVAARRRRRADRRRRGQRQALPRHRQRRLRLRSEPARQRDPASCAATSSTPTPRCAP